VRLFTFRGKQLAETSVGVNVEMGFSPDGKALVNFDLSDKTDARSGIWTLPRLKRAPAPAWAIEGETTFVQGARFVKRYAANSLSVVRWPDGRRLHTVAAGQNARLRALSGNGRFGLLHQRQEQLESLDWIDSRQGGASPSPAGRTAVSITPPLTLRADRSPGPSAPQAATTGSPSARPASTSKGHLSSVQPIHSMRSGRSPQAR
jgi:hypothetical protein